MNRPVPIPSARITRVAWSPFQRDRWHVEVRSGIVAFGGYARWRWQADAMAIEWMWRVPYVRPW